MASQSPAETIERIREAGYNPKIDALLELYAIAANIAAGKEPALPMASEKKKEAVKLPSKISIFARKFASKLGPKIPEVSEEDVRATLIINEKISTNSVVDYSELEGAFREILHIEKNVFLANANGIFKEFSLLMAKEFFSEKEKSIFEKALPLLQKYVLLQQQRSDNLSKLTFTVNNLEDTPENRRIILELFLAICNDDDLSKQAEILFPLIEILYEIDSILKKRSQNCKKIKDIFPFILGTRLHGELTIPFTNILTRRTLPCSQYLLSAGIAGYTQQEKELFLDGFMAVSSITNKQNLLTDTKKIGYIRPPTLTQFMNDLNPEAEYKACDILLLSEKAQKLKTNDILLFEKAEKLKKSFTAFFSGQYPLLQINFFKIVYLLLKKEPLYCADLKPLCVYCTEENPLQLPLEILTQLQETFSQTEDSPATVRAVVEALIPAMKYIHENLKNALNKFQLSAEILEVLPYLPEIAILVNGRTDLLALNTADIPKLPDFLRAIFQDTNHPLNKKFSERLKVLAQNESSLNILACSFDRFSKSRDAISTYSEEELDALTRDIDRIYSKEDRSEESTTLEEGGSKKHTPLDVFLKTLIGKRFLRKMTFLSTRIEDCPSSRSEDELLQIFLTTETGPLHKISNGRVDIIDHVFAEFKKTHHYSELNSIFLEEGSFQIKVKEKIITQIDPEIHKEIKLCIARFWAEKLREELKDKMSYSLTAEKAAPIIAPILHKMTEKLTEIEFKDLFLARLIDTQVDSTLKTLTHQGTVSKEYSAWLSTPKNRTKLISNTYAALKRSDWYKSLTDFFWVDESNPVFLRKYKKITSLSEIIDSEEFIEIVNDGITVIQTEIVPQIKQEEEMLFFISTRNKTAQDIIEKSFEKQVEILEEKHIFSDAVLDTLKKVSLKISKKFFERELAPKEIHSDFMSAYQKLLFEMPLRVLDALQTSFPEGKEAKAIFSQAFLENVLPLPDTTTVNKKKLRGYIKSHAEKYAEELDQGSIPSPDSLYEELKDDLQKNLFAKEMALHSIQQEFDKQIALLKEQNIFSEAVLKRLTEKKQKEAFLNVLFEKVRKKKEPAEFMAAYQNLLIEMPLRVLDVLQISFPEGKEAKTIFSEAFLENILPLPNTITVNKKKLKGHIQSHEEKYAAELGRGSKPSPDSLYGELKDDLRENLFEKERAIQQEFDRQIALLKEQNIFSDLVLEKLTKQKEAILIEFFKRVQAEKTHAKFIAACQELLIKMPCHVLNALRTSFPRGSLKPKAIFSDAFLVSIYPLPEKINEKKLKGNLQSHSDQYALALKEKSEKLPEPPYASLRSDLQENFPAGGKKASKWPSDFSTPLHSAKDSRRVAVPNPGIDIKATPYEKPVPSTPFSPLSTPSLSSIAVQLSALDTHHKSRSSVLRSPYSTPSKSPTATVRSEASPIDFEKIQKNLEKKLKEKGEKWKVTQLFAANPSSKSRKASRQKKVPTGIEICDNGRLVLRAQVTAPIVKKQKSRRLPFFQAKTTEQQTAEGQRTELEIETFRHKPTDVQLAADIMKESSLLDEKHVVEIHIEAASEAHCHALLIRYLQPVLASGAAKPEVWFKLPGKEKEKLTQDRVCEILLKKSESKLIEQYNIAVSKPRNAEKEKDELIEQDKVVVSKPHSTKKEVIVPLSANPYSLHKSSKKRSQPAERQEPRHFGRTPRATME